MKLPTPLEISKTCVSFDSFIRANDYFKEGKYDEAIDLYTEALNNLEDAASDAEIEQKRKTSIQLCMLNIAACALKVGNYDLVIDNCNQVLATQPGFKESVSGDSSFL